jgi:CRP/FNR family cyclic AMP-dependent transcriptional regulator
MNRFTLIDRAFFLKRTVLFTSLDLDLLIAIADKLTIIARGHVEIMDKENKKIATLDADDFFGDESLFSEMPRSYSAISKSESVLFALSRTNLLTIISECPSVATGFLQAYTSITPFRPRRSLKGEPS